VRSHAASLSDVAMDPHNRELTTVSEDRTIRIWDLDTFDQL
jgi:WD40 repeat protein